MSWGKSKRQREEEVLEEQKRKHVETSTIISIIEELRQKPDWTEKVTNPSLRQKYFDEAVEQGASIQHVTKALSILKTLAQCYCYGPLSSPPTKEEEDEDESVPVTILVGEQEFETSTGILTADNESMLNRNFSSIWFKKDNNTETKPVSVINTASNSGYLFNHILHYLNALKNKTSNLIPNIDELKAEEIKLLQQDCDYLGLRKLSIAIGVHFFTKSAQAIEIQKKANSDLETVKDKLEELKNEKAELEKRLSKLPDLIQSSEEDFIRLSKECNEAKSTRTCSPGDVIKIFSQFCQQFIIEEDANGHPIAKENLHTKSSYYRQDPKIVPVPDPTDYFHVCDEISVEKSYVNVADNFLPEVLSQSLEKHLDILLNEMPLDIHPGSNCQVVDLIHPSLYPYIHGISQVTDEKELTDCIDKDADSIYSWLPSEFTVSKDRNIEISSYINNLDQEKQPELYEEIGYVFKSMLPMFEKTLKKDLSNRKLQVIVKAAYYLITPGDSYSGSWHLEGMPHEHIIASGIYYISVSDNIQGNRLHFREELPDDHFDGEEHLGYGAGEEVELIYDLGSIETYSKRGLVWPNYLQHKVGQLSVLDPTKKKAKNSRSFGGGGSNKKVSAEETSAAEKGEEAEAGIRKILCFFLVDPDQRVVSTEIVPKQQDIISRKEAIEHRQSLMNERKYKADEVSAMWEERVYTFCEH
mmetsp:Transcript_40351/g.51951  ORF Transcript_40351/g.51951 Transcript_40351/m.51951 type:complete len:698 (-) Transcript_40351:173-2266(-)